MAVAVSQLYVWLEELLDGSSSYLFEEDRLYLLFPRQMSIDHLISNDSKAPDVALERVTVIF